MISGELAQLAQRLASDRVPFVTRDGVRARQPTSVRAGDSAVVLATATIEGFVGGRVRHLVGAPAFAARDGDRRAGAAASDARRRGRWRSPTRSTAPSSSSATRASAAARSRSSLSRGCRGARVWWSATTPIARALRDLARAPDYDVVVADADEAEPGSGDAAVIVASHGSGEERVLGEALSAGVPYVALVASRVRGAAVRAALDVPDELRQQLHTPAGLDIGARTPAEIAIAILAQLVAEHHAPPKCRGAAGHRAGLHRRPIRSAAWRWRSRMRHRISTRPAGGCTSAAPDAATPTPSELAGDVGGRW